MIAIATICATSTARAITCSILINDLLDISKIEAGQQEMSYEAVSLNDTLSEIVAMMQPQANRRAGDHPLQPRLAACRKWWPTCDSVRQIALNLLSNAMRYTLAGGQVIVSTAYEPVGEVVIRVRDTGIGMTEAEIEQALKPFRQLNDAPPRPPRRHRAWPAADQGDGRGQPGAVLDRLDPGEGTLGGGRFPVDAGARRLGLHHWRSSARSR